MPNRSLSDFSKLLSFAAEKFNGSGNKVSPVFQWLEGDVLAEFANQLAEDMLPEQQETWMSLLQFLQLSGVQKMPKNFYTDAKKQMTGLPETFFVLALSRLFNFVSTQKDLPLENKWPAGFGRISHLFLNDFNAGILKGLVWVSLVLPDAHLLNSLSALAIRSFKKMPGRGVAAGNVGNTILWVLSESAHPQAIQHLTNLKAKNIAAKTKSLIDNHLLKIAKKSGTSVADLEDMAVRDFGLDEDGQLEHCFGEYRAVIFLERIGKAKIYWFKPNGSPQKSVPVYVKNACPEALRALQLKAKDIATSSTAQRDRLDRMLRLERVWSYEAFEKNFLQHSLLGWLARRLIWKISGNGNDVNAFFTGKQWRDSFGNLLSWVGPDCSIQLWHPAGSSMHETLRWRAYLEEIQVIQPMKQAFREIYLLTEAELQTRIYSNRFAAHILKQLQFSALVRVKGWQYKLMTAYDDSGSIGIASLSLPDRSLRAEFWIQELNAEEEWNDTGIWQYVATDQVRFYRYEEHNPMNLVDVPPIVLSEVLRDADLFVGVSSVGNDPAWSDSGGTPAQRDYWQTYSFGDLSEMAKSRRDILQRLVPRLKIAAVAEIRDRFLVVRGKIRTYKIHMGSGNILMEPNDQYLCIVPDRKAENPATKGNLFLPFEGDTGLSVIISKALMLAEDDKITDTTITRQIRI